MSAQRIKNDSFHKLLWPLMALGIILLFNMFFTPGFFHMEIKDGHLFASLVDIVNRGALVMLLSIGMTLVFSTGGIDLSVGAVMAIAGALTTTILTIGIAPEITLVFKAAVIIGVALIQSEEFRKTVTNRFTGLKVKRG